jgi:hypothetical protein
LHAYREAVHAPSVSLRHPDDVMQFGLGRICQIKRRARLAASVLDSSADKDAKRLPYLRAARAI